MKNKLEGKKLLIIGGAFQHCKIVEAAKKMGVTVYVTDYLPYEKSPAKQIADKYFMYNITDIDEIFKMCKEEGIDGIYASHLDPCQRPYQVLCEKLNLPCFGTKEQYFKLTDKIAFKQLCRENNVDVIPEYKIENFENEEICNENVEFPIFIKPCDSRGSRGQTICNNYEEAKQAIKLAQSESSTGEIIIEKYMGTNNIISITFAFIDGKPYLVRTADMIISNEKNMEKVSSGVISPSKYQDLFIENVSDRVIKMIKKLGIKTGPVFMQGFVDGDTIRFYDQGLRFAGSEYELLYEKVFHKNPINAFIEFALTGEVSKENKNLEEVPDMKGKFVIALYPCIRPGIISKIEGLEEIKNNPKVVSVSTRYNVGEEIEEFYNVNQRFAEIDIVCDDRQDLKNMIDYVYNTLIIKDEKGNNMLFAKINTEKLIDDKIEGFKLKCLLH